MGPAEKLIKSGKKVIITLSNTLVLFIIMQEEIPHTPHVMVERLTIIKLGNIYGT